MGDSEECFSVVDVDDNVGCCSFCDISNLSCKTCAKTLKKQVGHVGDKK